ncbi:MAG: hypothetical protein NVSMB57_00320 [Actinomycetota bacterium]
MSDVTHVSGTDLRAQRKPLQLSVRRWHIVAIVALVPVLLIGAYAATNVAASMTQRALHARWESMRLHAHPSAEPAEPPGTRTVANGNPIARIGVPAIGMDLVVVEGTGPGGAPLHLSHTVLPGLPGVAAVRGGRFGYGNQFLGLERLVPGDVVMVQTLAGETRMTVRSVSIVAPARVDTGDNGGPPALLLLAPARAWGGSDLIVVRAEAAS